MHTPPRVTAIDAAAVEKNKNVVLLAILSLCSISAQSIWNLYGGQREMHDFFSGSRGQPRSLLGATPLGTPDPLYGR